MRRRVRATRAQRSPQEQAHDADLLHDIVLSIPEVARAHTVTLYVSMPGEPGTGPLRATLARLGVRVLLPIVLPDRRLDWALDNGRLAEPPGLGGLEPTGERLGELAPASADVLLIPALAVDTLGHRLGQGMGYYDRVLGLASKPVIALIHEPELLDAAVEPVPVEPHDRIVDAAATPLRCLNLR